MLKVATVKKRPSIVDLTIQRSDRISNNKVDLSSSFNVVPSRKIVFDISRNNDELKITGATDDYSLNNKRFDAVNMMLVGRRGKGKTLGQCALAHIKKTVFKERNLPFSVASNYWQEPSDIIHPDLVGWLNKFPPQGKNLYCCIDEIGSQTANRRSLAGVNVDFAQFLTQIRKRRNELTMTTQFPQWIDMAVLYQIDLFIRMEGRNGMRYVDMTIFDWWGQFTGNDHRKHWPPRDSEADDFRTLVNTHIMFDKYKTEQVVAPAWAKNRDQIIAQEFGEDWEAGIGDEWGFASPEAKAILEADQPETLEQLFEQPERPFAAATMLRQAKKYDPEIKTVKHLTKKLTEFGYLVQTEENETICYPPGYELLENKKE